MNRVLLSQGGVKERLDFLLVLCLQKKMRFIQREHMPSALARHNTLLPVATEPVGSRPA